MEEWAKTSILRFSLPRLVAGWAYALSCITSVSDCRVWHEKRRVVVVACVLLNELCPCDIKFLISLPVCLQGFLGELRDIRGRGLG
ncbi:hypothetical protein F4778DRAFT_374461 [Xylariomycetidae sp. FL2044]|nr:hypothetical protein F4778DRAFT_374461 [Xylariomycetidae sp. FL2044]